MSSKVIMGVINTFEACGVLDIKVTSWPIPIWCGVRGTLIEMNSKDFNLLSTIMNEGLTSSSYFLSNLSLPSTSWLIIIVPKIGIVKVWTCKGMILKLVSPLKWTNWFDNRLYHKWHCWNSTIGSNFHKHKTWGLIFEIKENNLVGLWFK